MIPLAACLFLFQSTGGELSSRLEKLRSPAQAERDGAQRWLARHLALADLDLVRAAARAGDAESRRRLSLALADDDAHLGLAVALAADPDATASDVGRGAVAERLARWCPAWSRKGLERSAALLKLAGRSDRPVAIEPRTSDRRLDVALDQLARFAPGAPAIVLDPDLALSDHPRDSLRDPASLLEGPFEKVLDDLVRLHRADFEAFAVVGDPESGEDRDSDVEPGEAVRPWIRVRRSVAGDVRTGTDRIVDWCVEVARPPEAPPNSSGKPDASRRSACARAIASTGWSGGIAWLAERAFAGKDECALDGVLLAAGRGQVAPALARPDVLKELLGRLAQPRADDVARAIAAAGAFGARGEDLGAIVAQDLPRLPPREQWLRLVALEGMRSSSPATASLVGAFLAAPGSPPPVRFQALRARAAMRPVPGESPPGTIAVDDPSAVLAWADGAGKGRECASLLVALGVPPPARPPLGQDGPKTDASLRLAELEWSLFTGDGSGAAPRLSDLAAAPAQGGLGVEVVAAATRAWVRRGAGARVRAATSAARSLPGASEERLERLEILSGAASAEVLSKWIARLENAPSGREDLLLLAAMAPTSVGEKARAALVRAVASSADVSDLAAALELALEQLRASRDDEEERSFGKAVGEAAREGPKEVRSRFRPDAWPPPAVPDAVRAAERDRALDRSGL